MSNIFQGGSTFSRGGGGPNAISIEIHITCDSPGGGGGGGVQTPTFPSGSAHDLYCDQWQNM